MQIGNSKITFHCLFEQSGTFKNVFKEFGNEAYDYDILNDYGQTDFQIDLFNEIEIEFDNITMNGEKKTIFSNMQPDKDFIIAFFPCTHFCDANQLQYRLWTGGKKLDFDVKNTERLIKRNCCRAYYFELYLKFCQICKFKKIPTIIENPASSGNSNYLVLFSPIPVAYVEKDRTIFGDIFKKPTNFFAINFEMKEQFEMFGDKNYEKKSIYKDVQGMSKRSEISPLYARNFYKRFIQNYVDNLKGEQND